MAEELSYESRSVRDDAAARRIVSSMRASRVAGRFALAIHQRAPLFSEVVIASKPSVATGSTASAAARSGGIHPASMLSRMVQDPSARARSTARSPAGVIRPCSTNRATRLLFVCDQVPPALRGVNCNRLRPSSSRRRVLSIHPKHSASSTASSSVSGCGPALLWCRTSQTPGLVSWCSVSHRRQPARSAGSKCSRCATTTVTPPTAILAHGGPSCPRPAGSTASDSGSACQRLWPRTEPLSERATP